MTRNIIMLRGYKRSGKDTAAAMLVESLGYVRRGFADALKDAVSLEMGLPRWMMDDADTKEAALHHMPVVAKDASALHLQSWLVGELRTARNKKPFPKTWRTADGQLMTEDSSTILSEPLYWTPRALCIYKGSVMRAVDPNHWVKTAMEGAASLDAPGIVIADWRYKSELAAVKKLAGPDARVITVSIDRFDSVDSTDPSERDLDDATFDVRISNKSTIEAFKVQVLGLGSNLTVDGTSTEPGL